MPDSHTVWPDANDLLKPPAPHSTRSQAKRDWDRRHPGTTYRLDPHIADSVRDIQTWYAEHGHHATLSQIAEDLLTHAIQEWTAGQVAITTRELTPATTQLTRTRDT